MGIIDEEGFKGQCPDWRTACLELYEVRLLLSATGREVPG